MGLSSEYVERQKLEEMRKNNEKLDSIIDMLKVLSMQLTILHSAKLTFGESVFKEGYAEIDKIMDRVNARGEADA